ncbi:MAG: Maf family protein [Anaerolineae bacterium]|nr:Maf family protein [Anaerolineae bacterium]
MLILASASPRRRQLLSWLNLPFEINVADIDETPLPGESPDVYTLRLAQAKAEAVASRLNPMSDADLILASDTTVSLDGEILGKPADERVARDMLTRLRGRKHQVFTAVALFIPGKTLLAELCTVDVPMRVYSDAEIAAYISSGDPMDKAGAYAIQHAGFHPVDKLDGCFAAVMGLPLCHVMRLLHQAGNPLSLNMPAHCLEGLGYNCTIAARIYPIYKS